jgi:hypothetical protein
MKVENMTGTKGNKIANQFIIYGDLGEETFQSYQSVIARKNGRIGANGNGKIILDVNKWDYSKTTGKYRNIFLGESKKETEAKIKSGEYQLLDLNN